MIQPFYERFGRRLQACRGMRRLSLADVGNQMSPPMTRAAIQKIETGQQRVAAHLLVQLARVLGVSELDLLPESESPRLSMDEWETRRRREFAAASKRRAGTSKRRGDGLSDRERRRQTAQVITAELVGKLGFSKARAKTVTEKLMGKKS